MLQQTHKPPTVQSTQMLVCWGWEAMGQPGSLQSRADLGSNSDTATASRVVLGESLFPSGAQQFPHLETATSLPRQVGDPVRLS